MTFSGGHERLSTGRGLPALLVIGTAGITVCSFGKPDPGITPAALVRAHEWTVSSWRDSISAETLKDLAWDAPCRNLFLHLAETAPGDLLRLVKSGAMGDVDLSMAAEVLADLQDPQANELLLMLARHEAAIVREGAVYGLMGHSSPQTLKMLDRLRATDASPGVRAAAAEALLVM